MSKVVVMYSHNETLMKAAESLGVPIIMGSRSTSNPRNKKNIKKEAEALFKSKPGKPSRKRNEDFNI